MTREPTMETASSVHRKRVAPQLLDDPVDDAVDLVESESAHAQIDDAETQDDGTRGVPRRWNASHAVSVARRPLMLDRCSALDAVRLALGVSATSFLCMRWKWFLELVVYPLENRLGKDLKAEAEPLLNALIGKVHIDYAKGKVAKDGYVNRTARALGMNGFYTVLWVTLMPCLDCSTGDKRFYKTVRNFSGLLALIPSGFERLASEEGDKVPSLDAMETQVPANILESLTVSRTRPDLASVLRAIHSEITGSASEEEDEEERGTVRSNMSEPPLSNSSMLDNGAMVWVPHADQVWKRAVVLHRLDDGARAEVRLEANEGEEHPDDGMVKTVNVAEIARLAGEVSDRAMPICNTFDSRGVDDMCTLNHLHEPAVLKNLQIRYGNQMPYTYTGQICIAVNPYQWLDLYGTHLYHRYLDEPRETLDPHPFALSATSYTDMKRFGVDQSILVSGESGAGKTETVKIMMNHLASISGGGDRGTLVIDQVLKTNPLLESFGNAKTKRNDNSSRFGKFAQLQFDHAGSLVGARCETYLLEKSRVVGQALGERNYHVFYQIFRLDADHLQGLRLHGTVRDYRYVHVGADAELTGIDDDQCLRETQEAMDVIGITKDEQDAIFKVVAAILNLGEINYVQGASEEKSHIENDDIVENVAFLLQTDIGALRSTLLERSITAGTESYTIPLNSEQAADVRDAVAKGLYTQLFDWLVHRINKAICSTKNVKSHIGLLDIFGFESFETNSFEQLCINYANEKLQQKFNSDVFKVVQKEYVEEEIPLDLVTFEDNQPILDLIEGRMGIVSLLNEERFQIICPSTLRNASSEEMVIGLLKELVPELSKNVKNNKFAIGKTKVYFSSGLLQQLEDRRNSILKRHALLIQKSMRGFVHRQRVRREREEARLRELALEKERQRQVELDRQRQTELELERQREEERQHEEERLRAERARQKELAEMEPEPVEDDWSEESEKEDRGPVSPRTLKALTEAASKVAEAEAAARDAKQAAEAALELNRELAAQNERLRATLSSNVADTFRNLAATLQTKNGYKRKEIPELPNKQLFGNFSEKIIQERVAKLNQFLEAATKAEYLQWGIRCIHRKRFSAGIDVTTFDEVVQLPSQQQRKQLAQEK
ncbi:hypothetical protein P43SY_002609 [Pythium insidiosum]|uniref:Myosin motor domain-containing protein n=1 Tax=Pythium insidiosum TaxID=114742 RepID=A0AAD5QB10_PYTIN|nr:hypothetical protein P43SY_002609 [Pythium insidiosum]